MTQTSPNSVLPDHPLLQAFLCALTLTGQTRSRDVLLSGMPSQEGLSFDLLARASARSGLDVEVTDVSSGLLEQSASPLVVHFQQGAHEGAFGLVRKLSGGASSYQLSLFADGETSDAERKIELEIELEGESLLAQISDQCLVVNRLVDVSLNNKVKAKPFSSWLLKECWRMRSVYRDVLLASTLLNLFIIASPLFVMNVYDRVVPNQAYETLWVLAFGVAVVFVFDLLIKFLRHFFIESSGRQIDVVLSTRLFERVMSLRPDSFPASVGAFANHFREFDSIKQFFTAATLTALVDLPFALLILAIIYTLGGALAIVPCLAGALIVIYGLLVHFPLKSAVQRSQHMMSQKNATLIESLSTIETLKVFNAEGRAQDKWEQLTIYLAGLGLTIRRLADSIGLVSQAIIQFSVVAVVIGGVYQIGEHQMSLGALIACVLLTSRALAPMVQVAALASQYYQAKSAVDGLNELSMLETEQGVDCRFIRHDAFNGDIEFSRVNFDYGDPNGNKRTALKDLDIKIRAGEHVALIGKIGAGKSSLLRLLLGLERVNSGQLKVDGIDVAQLNPVELRAAMAYVPQDVALLSGTLRENIALKQAAATDAELMSAADVAGLGDFIRGHAMGLDLPIGEQGKGLSGGQRQSVAIARAVLGKPEMFLLDELTSAMDNQTESTVIANIKALAQDKTLILSTHRASLLKLVDRVIVLDEGKVVADGAKDKVIDALKKGLIQTGKPV